MKLQYLTVIFIVIFLPIILVTSYHIQNRVETMNNQLKFDADLLDATYDAMAAFEINTANEDLSTVSDSLRSIIEASNNVFLNTLAINFGVSNASKSYVQPYIPAILYSLYDGYYIYSPTNTPIVCTDKFGQTISTDSFGVSYVGYKEYTALSGESMKLGIYKFDQDSIEYPTGSVGAIAGDTVDYNKLVLDNLEYEYGQMLYENEDGTYSTVIHTSDGATDNTKYKISYMLKSYVPYAVTYSGKTAADVSFNFTINYTLDNYMTILGTIDGLYYSKSGYLIGKDLIDKISVNGDVIKWNTYSDEELKIIANNPGDYELKIYFKEDINGNKVTISNRDNSGSWDDVKDATAYYARAWAFSEWVYNTDAFKELKEKHAVRTVYDLVNANATIRYNEDVMITDDTEYSEALMYNFKNSETLIFEHDPEYEESNFVQHKRRAIKNSITYNLCLAMTAYSDKYTDSTFTMPVLKDEEWDKILSNVSILTFMQGLNCGLKYYNNYAIVSSNNNEISVSPGEIYYTNYTSDITDHSSIETVHRINCPKLDYVNYYTSMKSKEIKYDKSYSIELEKYIYDHKVYTCYDCLVNANYIGISGKRNGADTLVDSIVNADSASYDYLNKLKAYYIALGKERENLYKPTSIAENSATQIFNFSTSNGKVNTSYNTTTVNLALPSSAKTKYGINNIYKIEVTLNNTKVKSGVKNLYTTTLDVALNDTSDNKYEYNTITIPTTSKSTRTLELTGNFYNASNPKIDGITFNLGNQNVSFYLKSIKIYYK